MSLRKLPNWLLLLLLPVGLLLVTIPATWVFVSLTTTPLYPNPEAVPSVAKSAPSPKWADVVERARQIVRASVAEQNLPGLSVAIGIDGDIVWAEGFGFADLKASVPVTPDHRFRIGTASTVLTSAAVSLLLKNTQLKLDDEIQTHVPTFPQKEWPVTLRELMSHTAGISPEDEGSLFTKHCERPLEALQYFKEKPLLFKPGTQVKYSSNGWILVSAAVEAAAHQPFLTFMQKRIFTPLGMHNTGADPALIEGDEDFPVANLIRELIYDPEAQRGSASAKKPLQNRVTPYFTRFASDPNYGIHTMRPLDYSCYAGASAFVSTPSDLVRFGMKIDKAPDPGWYHKTVTLAGKQTRLIGQDGDSLGGTVASLLTFPDHGIVVAVTSNIPHSDTATLGMKITETFLE